MYQNVKNAIGSLVVVTAILFSSDSSANGTCDLLEKDASKQEWFEDILYGQLNSLPQNTMGVAQKHVEALANYCQQNRTMLIIRVPNPVSLNFHGRANYISKPVEVKFKTRKLGEKGAGLVEVPKEMSKEQAKHLEELIEKGYRVTEDGLLISPNKEFIFADYDLQGVYRRDELNNWEMLGEKDYVNQINDVLGMKLINHGANDSFIPGRIQEGAWSKPIIGRKPTPYENYLVIKEDGSIEKVNNTADLKTFYRGQRLPWIYDQRF